MYIRAVLISLATVTATSNALATEETELAFKCKSDTGNTYMVFFNPDLPSSVVINVNGNTEVRRKRGATFVETQELVAEDSWDKTYYGYRNYKMDFGGGRNLIVRAGAYKMTIGAGTYMDYDAVSSEIVLDGVKHYCVDKGTANYTTLDRIVNGR